MSGKPIDEAVRAKDALRIVRTAIQVCEERDRPAMAEDLESVQLYIEQTATLTAAQQQGQAESPEDLFEQFVQAEIARSPNALRELGDYLGDVLDEDRFPRANALLLQLATEYAPQPMQQGGGDLDEVVCLACGQPTMHIGQVCYACSHPVSAPPSAPTAQGGGELPEAELIALVAGPYHYHHKMDEAAEREGKAFDRCRELTIQNIRTWCATRRAMLAAAPPSVPVGDCPDCTNSQQCNSCSRDEQAVLESSAPVGVEEMQRRLDREESDHGRTIDQRDAAEDALGRMFQAVTGRVAEWSSAWGYTDAIEEVEEHVAALAQQPGAVDEAMVERATMALLGKSHDTAPGVDWRCDRTWTVNKVRKHMRAALTAALAQQPGAVDEAMVERAALAYEAEVDGDTHSPNVPREAMRAALNAALATPHQEPKS